MLLASFLSPSLPLYHCLFSLPSSSHAPLSCSSPPSLTKLQIDFDSWFENNLGNDYLTLVNGTDFWILWKGLTKKGIPFGSPKYGGKSTLQYELGIDIQVRNLV